MKQLTQPTSGRILRTRLLDDFDQAFDQFFQFPKLGLGEGRLKEFGTLGFEISETDEAYHLSLDVPGLTKEDIKIEVDGQRLLVTGERKREESQNAKIHQIWSRSYGSFSQEFSLPEWVDLENIVAKQEHGVLNLTLPKSTKAQKKTITIS